MEPFGVPDWLILVITAAILLYVYAARNRNYWKKQNVPHEPFFLFFGPIMRRLTKPDHLEDQKHYKKLGRVFGVYEGGKPTLMVGEPDLVKRILVKDFAALSDRLCNHTYTDKYNVKGHKRVPWPLSFCLCVASL